MPETVSPEAPFLLSTHGLAILGALSSVFVPAAAAGVRVYLPMHDCPTQRLPTLPAAYGRAGRPAGPSAAAVQGLGHQLHQDGTWGSRAVCSLRSAAAAGNQHRPCIWGRVTAVVGAMVKCACVNVRVTMRWRLLGCDELMTCNGVIRRQKGWRRSTSAAATAVQAAGAYRWLCTVTRHLVFCSCDHPADCLRARQLAQCRRIPCRASAQHAVQAPGLADASTCIS